jgi:hypothetical protein
VRRVLPGKVLLAGKDTAVMSMLTFKLAAAAAARVQSVSTGSSVVVMAVPVPRLLSREHL